MGRPLLVAFAFALALAGCGGGETVQPVPETVVGTVPEQEGAGTTLAEEGSAEDGLAVYEAQGCGGCHTYEAAGSNAQLGPNLDESLQGKDQGYIVEAIVNPDATIAEGFQPGVMPQDYDEQLDDRQLADLVAFLTPQS